MRGITHRWRLRDGSPGPAIPAGSGVEPLTARILSARGLAGEHASKFLDPRLTDLHDPALLPNATRAAERILDALAARQPIVIYGDYDVDGVTASAILFHLLRAIAPDAPVSIYIPHRVDEGYGLNADAIRTLCTDGAAVIVSVDCGVTALEPARVARECGADLIITDHHNMLAADGPNDSPPLPDCFAVVHPRLPGSRYPFHELAGAGVAFKLAWRIATMHAGSERVPAALRETLLDLLALAALGTIADIVPLVDENRVIARFGLARLRAVKNEGLLALIDASGLANERVSAEDVGFKLGPRLNACGRLGHAREAAELLTTATGARAFEIAAQLTALNKDRQNTERKIFQQANDLAEQLGMCAEECRAIVLAHEDWHPGVVGIVCSRLVERRRRPTILMRRHEGECHGSGRSVPGVSLHAALQECADLLVSFGGHDMAAGVRVSDSNLGPFTERFTEIINSMHDIDGLTPLLDIDCESTLSELSPRAVQQVASIGPFGRDNPRPTLLVRELTVAQAPKVMGKQSQHLSLAAKQGVQTIRLVGWSWGDRAAEFQPGRRFHAAFRASISDWHAERGQQVVEATLEDLAFAD
jgi:single-stranded-DNA-specific exonuclease